MCINIIVNIGQTMKINPEIGRNITDVRARHLDMEKAQDKQTPAVYYKSIPSPKEKREKKSLM